VEIEDRLDRQWASMTSSRCSVVVTPAVQLSPSPTALATHPLARPARGATEMSVLKRLTEVAKVLSPEKVSTTAVAAVVDGLNLKSGLTLLDGMWLQARVLDAAGVVSLSVAAGSHVEGALADVRHRRS